MDLIHGMRTQYSSAKRWLLTAFWLGVFQLALVIAALADPLKQCPIAVAVVMLVIQGVLFACRFLCQTKYGFAEEVRRAALIKNSLNRDPPGYRLTQMALKVGKAKDKEPAYIGSYYSSSLPVGVDRLVENLHESIFFTSELAKSSSRLFGGIASGGFVLASIVLSVSLTQIARTGVAAGVDPAVVGQAGISVLAFFVAGDHLQLALGYNALSQAAQSLLGACEAVKKATTKSLDEAIAVAGEYGVALASAPLLLSFAYEREKQAIQNAWDKYLKTP